MDNGSFNNEADRVLVDRFKRTKDEATFREIYGRHTPALYLLALRLFAGSEADAQDAVQETWIRACRSLPTFAWRSSLRTWLTGILINRVREMNRGPQRKHEVDQPDQLIAAIKNGPSDQRDLERAIAHLPDGYRHVFLLHDVEGYTHEEISAQLDISAGTSKSQLFHARKALRTMLNLK
jgi:RNA polymerase sigma-70 factor (ECF subfamily)